LLSAAVHTPQASDQYLLEGLKRLCEATIAQSLSVDNVAHTFDMSEAFSAPQVSAQSCLAACAYVPIDDVLQGCCC
jgi:hypothetical protein